MVATERRAEGNDDWLKIPRLWWSHENTLSRYAVDSEHERRDRRTVARQVSNDGIGGERVAKGRGRFGTSERNRIKLKPEQGSTCRSIGNNSNNACGLGPSVKG